MHGQGRVAWKQGMLLRPQHFQQQDRHVDALIEARVAPLSPYPWGLVSFKLNENLANLGKFALESCSGILPDGQPFSWPADGPPPTPLDIPDGTQNKIVYLTLPARQPGQAEYQARQDGALTVRFGVEIEDVPDAYSSDRPVEPIQIAKPNLQFGVTPDQIHGRVRFGLACVRDIQARQVIWDTDYVPPMLDVRGHPRLSGLLGDILGRAQHQAGVLAVRAVESAQGGADTFGPFLRLVILNRWVPILAHLSNLPSLHPERLYEALVSLLGELSTWVRADRRAQVFPPYDHEDLKGTFAPVVEALRLALSLVPVLPAVEMPLIKRAPGAYVSEISEENRELYRTGYFFLAVKSDLPMDETRSRFPRLATVAAFERMPVIVANALDRGVLLRQAISLPPQLRAMEGYVYFELDRGSDDWPIIEKSRALGLNIRGEWPSLFVELWCVRQPGR